MVIIKEFLPNPVGKDTEGEWIKLFNNGDQEIDLGGWRLKDASGKMFIFGGSKIKSGEELTLDYKTTKISLNNDGETIFLFDKNKELVDQLSFSGKISEGEIVARDKKDILSEIKASQFPSLVASPQIINPSVKNVFNADFLIVGLTASLVLSFLALALIKKFTRDME